jgi:hypothetical protein
MLAARVPTNRLAGILRLSLDPWGLDYQRYGRHVVVYEIATVKIKPGKTPEALEWLAKIAAYIKRANPGWQVSRLTPTSGDLDNEIVLLNNCPSLSEYDAGAEARREKPEWQALVKEIRESDWFLGLTRRFYRVME